MIAEGPRKGEPSSCFMRYGLRPQPARLVRGSSRRIMTMRFRPANIRVINRRVCSSAVIRLLSKTQKQKRSKLTSGNVFPPTPARRGWDDARAVLAVKGSLRRAKLRRALDGSAPLRPDQIATGGSGGNARRPAAKKKAGFAPIGRGAGPDQNPSTRGGLTRSLHIRSAAARRSAIPGTGRSHPPRTASP